MYKGLYNMETALKHLQYYAIADTIDIAPNKPVNVGHTAQRTHASKGPIWRHSQGQKLHNVLCNPDTTLATVIPLKLATLPNSTE